jgi:hypothetical protein
MTEVKKYTLSIINGSIGGRTGNTFNLIKKLKKTIHKIDPEIKVHIIHLHPNFNWPHVRKCIRTSNAFVFCTGTYWQSWGSPLQHLFEKMTEIEGKKHLLGKPAGAIVTMHSVGGQEVTSRIQGVLCSLGCVLPPFSGFAYSYADHVAHRSRYHGKKLMDDVWHIEDTYSLIFNIIESMKGTNNWKVWDFLDTDAYDPTSIWLK